MPEWLKGTGCKPVGYAYLGSNPSAPTISACVAQSVEHFVGNEEVTGSSPVGATIFGCNTAYGTCVVSGLVTLKGTIHSLLGQTNQVAGMCKSMMMMIRRLTSVAIRFDAWEETRVQR